MDCLAWLRNHIDVWEIRKHKLYDSDSEPGQQLHSGSSPGDRNAKFSQNGKLGHSCTNVTKGKLYGSRVSDRAIVHLGLNVSSSAHNCGCVVDGGNAVLLLLHKSVHNYVIQFFVRSVMQMRGLHHNDFLYMYIHGVIIASLLALIELNLFILIK